MIDGADVLLDTSILLYAALGREDEPARYETARRIILEEDYAVCVWSLAAFYVQATHNAETPLQNGSAEDWIQTLARKPCQPMDDKLLRDAMSLVQQHDLSLPNALLIAGAKRLGCRKIYSQNLEGAESVADVEIVNPFN
ncbi:MAG: hypothetical protein CMK06_07660 [Ponticaulis sp.]|nr:hypothetical protein [Ponticaulis sp.]